MVIVDLMEEGQLESATLVLARVRYSDTAAIAISLV
jgi:hypothetical protein